MLPKRLWVLLFIALIAATAFTVYSNSKSQKIIQEAAKSPAGGFGFIVMLTPTPTPSFKKPPQSVKLPAASCGASE